MGGPIDMERLIDEQQLQQRIEELAKEISQDYRGKTVHLLCLLKGSAIFLADLAKKMDFDIETEFHFLEVSSYGATTKSSGKLTFHSRLRDPLTDKDVLIVEDIIDTGHTLSLVLEYIKKEKPRSLEIVTLLDKPSRRVVHDIQPKYIGFSIPDKFVIGYGLDFNQRYRNLPFIGILDADDIS